MITYTVYMVNFDLNKGTFNSQEEAISQAKALGFECTIIASNPSIAPITIKPY